MFVENMNMNGEREKERERKTRRDEKYDQQH